MKKDLNRRAFLERLGACTVGSAALSQVLGPRARAQSSPDSQSWTAPHRLTNPNILFVIVDQMRWPQWLSSSQLTMLNKQVLPNIFGRLRDNSYVFQQYYTAATVCTAARGTLMTGLYAPQTGVYIDGGLISDSAPALLPAFPTWGEAIQALNPDYLNNCWWFGKWHLSACTTSTPLLGYGFNTRTYPGGPDANPSPNGTPNEGTNGGQFGKQLYASDADIANDFIGWLQGEAPTPAPPLTPWCATVSLINPHDITKGPAWLDQHCPPPGVSPIPVYFQPPPFPPVNGCPAVYAPGTYPTNFENLKKVKNKPSLQYTFQSATNNHDQPVTDWGTFLNWYYWLQNYVDVQVGRVLDALQNSPYQQNTIVIFASDHGEYAGSHGLHDKGSTVYEEAIHVPLYVHYPGQTGLTPMNQMCSSVDFFGLMCDLATKGGGLWQTGPQAYPDLASRQSIWHFLYQNSRETRVGPALGIPYIFHTCDENGATPNATKYHIVGLRGKTNANNTAQPGAKLGVYSEWGECTVYPDSTPPDYEFYDYNPATSNNTKELGNDYYSSDPTTQATILAYVNELGSWTPQQTGLIATELNPPLVGLGTDGNPLSQAQAQARQNYFNYTYGSGACPG
ncbi:MAG TPA: sulfatase-like hydrolase/transferase [Bryobacteraceae bacterium]|nr:sulfatase-like hydrolase/transferase [Bryobacteraceae bacterium]